METVIQEDIDDIETLALDWMTGLIYWLDQGNAHIEVARINGTHRRRLINATVNGITWLDQPRALVLHPKMGFVLAYRAFFSMLQQCNECFRLIFSRNNLTQAFIVLSKYLTLFLAIHSLMFWANTRTSNGAIMTAWMDGTNIRSLISQGSPMVTCMAVDEQHHRLYWADSASFALMSSNVDGTDVKTLLHLYSYNGIINSLSVFKVDKGYTDALL